MIVHDYDPHQPTTGDELEDAARFEPIYRRNRGEFPVRSHGSQTRARLRGRASAAARRKARAFNGAHRRRLHNVSP